jgi:hypothetical protein
MLIAPDRLATRPGRAARGDVTILPTEAVETHPTKRRISP